MELTRRIINISQDLGVRLAAWKHITADVFKKLIFERSLKTVKVFE